MGTPEPRQRLEVARVSWRRRLRLRLRLWLRSTSSRSPGGQWERRLRARSRDLQDEGVHQEHRDAVPLPGVGTRPLQVRVKQVAEQRGSPHPRKREVPYALQVLNIVAGMTIGIAGVVIAIVKL